MNRKVILKVLAILAFITSLHANSSISEKFGSLKQQTKNELAKVKLKDVVICATGITLVGLSLFLVKRNFDMQFKIEAVVEENKEFFTGLQFEVVKLACEQVSTRALIESKADEFCAAASGTVEFGQEVVKSANQALKTIYMRLSNHRQWMDRQDAKFTDLVKLVEALKSFRSEEK